MAPPTSICGHRTAAVDHSTCHPRACPEGPFRRGTAPLESGQEPVSGMDCRDKPGNDSLIRLDKALGSCESATREDRKSVVWGKSVSGRVNLGGRRTLKKK